MAKLASDNVVMSIKILQHITAIVSYQRSNCGIMIKQLPCFVVCSSSLSRSASTFCEVCSVNHRIRNLQLYRVHATYWNHNEWSNFHRQFKCILLRKKLYCCSDYTDFSSHKSSRWQFSFSLGNGFAENRRQIITWTNDVPVSSWPIQL